MQRNGSTKNNKKTKKETNFALIYEPTTTTTMSSSLREGKGRALVRSANLHVAAVVVTVAVFIDGELDQGQRWRASGRLIRKTASRCKAMGVKLNITVLTASRRNHLDVLLRVFRQH
jgi:tRNA U34 5-carboxymethylaminomethyl modifying enzyme MnmG/GidA